MLTLPYSTLAAYGAGLLATLVLARLLTPSHWWRCANARAGAVLALGTWGIGSLLAPIATAALAPPGPETGERYVVYRALNLREGTGTDAARLGVLPAGTPVTATGRSDGDWWQVQTVDDRTGWASSLWLRRPGERQQ